MIISVLISFLGPQARKKKENAKFVCLTATCLNGEKNGLTKRATGPEKKGKCKICVPNGDVPKRRKKWPNEKGHRPGKRKKNVVCPTKECKSCG